MSRYLLDTDVLIHYSKGREPETGRIQAMIASGDELGVSAVTIAEFFAGLAPGSHPTWHQFIAALKHWPVTYEDGVQAGRFRYDFARKGQVLPTVDALIAAVAQGQNAILVTNNPRHYPMSSVQLLTLGP